MSNQLKAGDICLVVGCDKCHVNLGKVVELVRFVSKGEKAINGLANRDCWVTRGEGIAYASGDDVVIGNIGLSAPNHLMPLRGDFAPEEMLEMEKGHA